MKNNICYIVGISEIQSAHTLPSYALLQEIVSIIHFIFWIILSLFCKFKRGNLRIMKVNMKGIVEIWTAYKVDMDQILCNRWKMSHHRIFNHQSPYPKCCAFDSIWIVYQWIKYMSLTKKLIEHYNTTILFHYISWIDYFGCSLKLIYYFDFLQATTGLVHI